MAYPARSNGKVIVFGIVFWYPLAGVTYQFLHYLIGLRRLGYDPYYIEDSTRWVYDPDIDAISPDALKNINKVARVFERYGFADRWAFRGSYKGGECYGMPETQILKLYQEADAFLNITGSLDFREEHFACRRRIYVETDPFASQVLVWEGNEWKISQLRAHDVLFSFGENIGSPDCDVPVSHFQWLPTRQPVVLDIWDNKTLIQGDAYRTIATWKNKQRGITFRGETYYWTKDIEFMKVIDLPAQCSSRFELGLNVAGRLVGDEVLSQLRRHGWQVVDSVTVSKDIDSYRRYIQHSRGELTVARDQYVRPRTGWFSDRSACYLTAGRPVIMQDTGFGKRLPTGKGLFAFRTTGDILGAIETIESDYQGNCQTARDIAVEYFSAENVIGSLMQRAGL
jgi:hypothetical protein